MTYAEFIKDKTVCLIAPSATTVGTKQREFIEGHDVVARINNGFPVPEAMVPDIGERTDVLYHLLGVGIAGSEANFKQCIGKVRFVVSVHPRGETRTEAFIRFNRGRVPFEAVPTGLRQTVKRNIRGSPNAGVMSISHLLMMPIKSLHLTGFSFYTAGYYTGYGGKSAHQAKLAIVRGGRGGGHDQPSQRSYLRHLIANATFPVTMDKRMEELLAQPNLRKGVVVPDPPRTIILTRQRLAANLARRPAGAGPDWPTDMVAIGALPQTEMVGLRALKTLRRENRLILAGDTFIANARDAFYLVEHNRAEVA
jgi:hypothetical protein